MPTQTLPWLYPACKLAAVRNMPTNPLADHKVSINRTSYCTFKVIQPVLWGSCSLYLSGVLEVPPRGLISKATCLQYPRGRVAPISVSVTADQMPASINQMDIYTAERHPQLNTHKHECTQQSHRNFNGTFCVR